MLGGDGGLDVVGVEVDEFIVVFACYESCLVSNSAQNPSEYP